MSLAAVALFTTACQDTDAQYEIPVVGAPDFVSITPADGALVYGEKTITVTFDKNINFMTKNADKVTLNGVPVKKALVLGASNTLTITVDVDFNKEHKGEQDKEQEERECHAEALDIAHSHPCGQHVLDSPGLTTELCHEPATL